MKVLTLSAVSKGAPSPTIDDHFDYMAAEYGIDFEHIHVHVGESLAYPRALAALQRQTMMGDFDVVHAFYGFCAMIGRLQVRAPLVATFQGTDLLGGLNGAMHARDGKVGRAAARFANRVIVMSDEMAGVSGRDDAKVIPFGINTDIFAPSSRDEARMRLGLSPTKHLVLFPYAPTRAEKNFPIAERAVRSLQERGLDIELIPVYSQSRDTVAQYMNACDALVMVSDHEGSPVAVREGLACNLPIVSVTVGDVASVIEPFEECAIVDLDASSVAAGLEAVLSNGRRTDSAGHAATFDVASSAQQVLTTYLEVVSPEAHTRQLQRAEG